MGMLWKASAFASQHVCRLPLFLLALGLTLPCEGFDDNALKLLVSKCPELYNLQLSEIGKLTDLSLGILHPLTNLTTLDISRSGLPEGTSLTGEGVVALLEAVGENLVELVLDRSSFLP